MVTDLMSNNSNQYFRDHLLNLNNKKEEDIEEPHDILSEYSPTVFMSAKLAFLELEVAMDNLISGKYEEAQNVIADIDDQIKNLEDNKALELANQIFFEKELILQAIKLINQETDISDFIQFLENIIETKIIIYKGSEKIDISLIPLLKIALVLLNEEKSKEALILLKKVNDLSKDFSEETENIEYIDLFVQLLSKLREIYQDEETLNFSDQVIESLVYKLSNLDVSPEEFIKCVIYLKEAQELDNKNESEKLIKYFNKEIELLKLYPNSEKIEEIKDQLGHAYLEIGIAQKLNGQNNEAYKSLDKALDYLADHDIVLYDFLHLIDFFKVNYYELEIELENKNYNEVDSRSRFLRHLFKRKVNEINDTFLFEIYLNILNQLFIVSEELEEYRIQQEVYLEVISLIDKKYSQFDSFSNIFPVLANFNNLNMQMEKYRDKWNWREYIDEIVNKLLKLDIFNLKNNYDQEVKDGILNLLTDYKDFNDEQKIDLPRDFLLNMFYLSQELPENCSANKKLNRKYEESKLYYHD